MQELRNELGAQIHVTSGFRCKGKQADLSAAGYETAQNSLHLLGMAADIRTGKHSGVEIESAARKVGFKAVGVAATWIHVDVRQDKERRWFYSKRR